MIIPPIKCQGIKTRLVPAIKVLCPTYDRWVEPFCGSCVVALNIQPGKALLCDSNEHIIRFYKDIQSGLLTGDLARAYLSEQGSRLKQSGEDVYYEIRDQFNQEPTSLAFLFLNRACFNGVIRFNRNGKFNVPFCRKHDRFSRAYISKISNQITSCARIIQSHDWQFRCSDFRQVLSSVKETDFVYADPPYAGRNSCYYNSWSEKDECDLVLALKTLPCRFLLSTWYQNKYRTNPTIQNQWLSNNYVISCVDHFYHVGPTLDRRISVVEALISNYQLH